MRAIDDANTKGTTTVQVTNTTWREYAVIFQQVPIR